MLFLAMTMTVASAQISVSSEAQGNKDGVVHEDKRTFATTADWANAGYHAETDATAEKDDWDPPQSEYHATTWLDQGIATDAQLHANGVMRQPYRGRFNNGVAANSIFDMNYTLLVENLSGQEIRLVFGNSLHGTFGVRDQAGVFITQTLDVSGFSSLYGSVQENINGYGEFDAFTGFIHNADLVDSLYGQFTGHEIGMFQIIGQKSFAAGSSESFDVHHFLGMFAGMPGGNSGGLAVYDFSSTGHMLVNAYDPSTGADLTDQIRVSINVVPEPATLLVLGGLAALVRRRSLKPQTR